VTTSSARPRLAIGLPVFNGETYLRLALDSLLAQTFRDFQIIVSDNASTDGTEAICRDYAARDRRVRYTRNDRNIGGFANSRRTVELADAELFMWAAHDDVHHPEYAASCVEVLEERPEVVLCYCAIQNIGGSGDPIETRETRLRVDAPQPHQRFREMIRTDYRIEPIFGVMRLDVLRRTGLQGNYADSDRVLLAEMSLHGPFHRIDRTLFFRRDHESRSIRANPGRHARAAWIHPGATPVLTFPYHRQFREYLLAIRRSGIPPRQRWRCYGHMAAWLPRQAGGLWSDYENAARVLLGPMVARLRGRESG